MFDLGEDHWMLKAESCSPRHMIQEINEKALWLEFLIAMSKGQQVFSQPATPTDSLAAAAQNDVEHI